jgi:hypothetical protein
MSLPKKMLAAILLVAGAGVLPAEASAGCAVRLTAFDAAGLPVARADGYGIGAGGTILAPLSIASAGVQRWSRLVAAFDSPAVATGTATVVEAPVDRVRMVDRDHDLAFLIAPGLPACGDPPADPATEAGGGRSAPAWPGPGTVLTGVRQRLGYRSREFRAEVERTLRGPGGAEILIARLIEPGGADSGLLFDDRGDLVAVILPPPPDGDPDRIAAVRFPSAHNLGPARETPLRDTLAAATATGAPPVRLFAQALLISRDNQADRALRLLEQTARAAGEFDDLVLERGIRRFELGRTEPAIDDFFRVAAHAPDHHAAHYNLGVALGAAGRYADALAAFSAAARIDPGHPGTRFQMALALAALGDPRAREECAALRQIDPGMAADLESILTTR